MAEKATMVFTTRSGATLALEPFSGRTGAIGVFMPREGVDQFFPLPKYAEQYAESPDTEGGRRVFSEVQNAVGSGSVVVAGDDEPSFRTYHQQWQSFIEAMRREGGTLTYTPAGKRTNLCIEPSPEVALGGKWTGTGRFFNNPSTLTRDTATTQLDGTACFKVVTPGSLIVEGIAIATNILCAEGQYYTHSIYLKGNVGGEEVKLSLGSSEAGTAVSPIFKLTTEWQRYTVTLKATKTASLQWAITGPNSLKAQTFYADCSLVEEAASEPQPFFPTVAQLAASEVAWEGAAWESKSNTAGSVAVTYEVESMRITDAKYDGVQALAFVQEFGFEFTCRPFGLLSSEDQILRDHDPFSRDTIASGEWAAFDAGSGTLAVEGGQLVPSSVATKRLYRFGLRTADASVTFKVTTGASVATGANRAIMKRASSTEYLQGGLVLAGASSRLRLIKVVGGVATTVSETGTFTTNASTAYWTKFTVVGNATTVELFTADPESGAAPVQTLSTTLTGENATKFGEGVWGNAGLYLEPQATDYRWDEWRWDAKAFRSTSPVVDMELPNVPGHVDALGDLTVKDTASQVRQYAEFGLETGETYSPSVAPPNLIDSDQLLTGGFAGAQATRTGAYDPLASGNNVVRASLSSTPCVVCGTSPQPHVGDYRVKARVYTVGTGPVFVRLGARYGAGRVSRGEWQQVPMTGEWCEVDLELAAPAVTPVGTQGWEARIEAVTESASTTIDVDYLLLLGAGRFGRSSITTKYETPVGLLLEDKFEQTAGELSGKAIASSVSFLGPNAPGTVVNDASVGTGAWSSPENAKTSNDAWAEIAGGESSLIPTNYLKTSKHGFAVPVGATILGIEVKVEKHSNHSASVEDGLVVAVKAGTVVGSNHAIHSYWSTTDSVTTYGSESDLWGTTWTPEQINAEGFGIALAALISGGSSTRAYVDAISITVYYVPSGGSTWGEAGHEPKFQVNATTHTWERTSSTDAANTGRVALAGTDEHTTSVTQGDVHNNAATGKVGLLMRYVNTENFIIATLTGSPYKVQVMKYVGKTATYLNKPQAGYPLSKVAGQQVTLRLETDSNGRWIVWADGVLLGQGFDEVLATGKALAKGRVGFYSEHGASEGAVTDGGDNFKLWVPEANAVMWEGREVRFRWADALSNSSDGLYWHAAPEFEGARLRVPPEGPAGLTSRLTAKARRLNVTETVDPFISDEIEVSMRVTPRVVLLG